MREPGWPGPAVRRWVGDVAPPVTALAVTLRLWAVRTESQRRRSGLPRSWSWVYVQGTGFGRKPRHATYTRSQRGECTVRLVARAWLVSRRPSTEEAYLHVKLVVVVLLNGCIAAAALAQIFPDAATLQAHRVIQFNKLTRRNSQLHSRVSRALRLLWVLRRAVPSRVRVRVSVRVRTAARASWHRVSAVAV